MGTKELSYEVKVRQVNRRLIQKFCKKVRTLREARALTAGAKRNRLATEITVRDLVTWNSHYGASRKVKTKKWDVYLPWQESTPGNHRATVRAPAMPSLEVAHESPPEVAAAASAPNEAEPGSPVPTPPDQLDEPDEGDDEEEEGDEGGEGDPDEAEPPVEAPPVESDPAPAHV